MVHHPGQAISEYHVASLVNIAYQKAATVAVHVNGFRAAGIYPFDRDIFSDADFLLQLLLKEQRVQDQPMMRFQWYTIIY
jgi:hypothetical protein